VDYAAERTTLWNEKGEFLKVLHIVPEPGATPILNFDHQGHGYRPDYRPILGSQEPGMPVLTDSFPLLRVSFDTQKIDTIAQLKSPRYGDARFGEQVQRVAMIFSANDLFGALPDGSVWIARGHENRVDWRAPDGTWRIGKPRPYARIPVTQADKDRFMQRMRERGLPTQVEVVFPFAEYKPPFEGGLTRPSGEVWLQRPRASETEAITYDVWGRDGGWKRAVTFPVGASLAGFGANGAIYGVVKDGETRRVARFRE